MQKNVQKSVKELVVNNDTIQEGSEIFWEGLKLKTQELMKNGKTQKRN